MFKTSSQKVQIFEFSHSRTKWKLYLHELYDNGCMNFVIIQTNLLNIYYMYIMGPYLIDYAIELVSFFSFTIKTYEKVNILERIVVIIYNFVFWF